MFLLKKIIFSEEKEKNNSGVSIEVERDGSWRLEFIVCGQI
jgi:hypothetical protein